MKTFLRFLTEGSKIDDTYIRLYELGHDIGVSGVSPSDAARQIQTLVDQSTTETYWNDMYRRSAKDSAVRGYKDGVRQRQHGSAKANPNADKYVQCPRCNGSGQYSYNMIHGTMCYGCNGLGYVLRADAKKIKAKKIDPNGESITPEMMLSFVGTAVWPINKRYPHDPATYAKIKKIQIAGSTGHVNFFLDNGQKVVAKAGNEFRPFGINPDTGEKFDLRDGKPWRWK